MRVRMSREKARLEVRRGCGGGADVSRARTAAVALGRISHGWRGWIAMRAVAQDSEQQSAAIAVLLCVVVLLRRGRSKIVFGLAPAWYILGPPS